MVIYQYVINRAPRTKIIAGLLLGFISLSLGLLCYGHYYKCIINTVNLSWLVPVYALIIGCVISRYRFLLFFFVLALLMNPLECMGTYIVPYNNSTYENFLGRHVAHHKSDIVLYDNQCPNITPNSPLFSYLVNKEGSSELPTAFACLANRTAPRIYVSSYRHIYQTLRALTCDNLASGRIWVVYNSHSLVANDMTRTADDLTSMIIRQNKYFLLRSYSAYTNDLSFALFAPINSSRENR